MAELLTPMFINTALIVAAGCIVLAPLLAHAWPEWFDPLHQDKGAK